MYKYDICPAHCSVDSTIRNRPVADNRYNTIRLPSRPDPNGGGRPGGAARQGRFIDTSLFNERRASKTELLPELTGTNARNKKYHIESNF